MIPESKAISGVAHPFVSSAHLRKYYRPGKQGSVNVLVIQSVNDKTIGEGESREKLYSDFLANLDLISDAVSQQNGRFDRIDIRL